MTKIYYEETGINNLIKPKLENSINNLKDSIKLSNQLYIPYAFRYRNYLNLLKDSLKTDLNTINQIYEFISKSSNGFQNINDKLNLGIYNIDNYSISLRQSAIK